MGFEPTHEKKYVQLSTWESSSWWFWGWKSTSARNHHLDPPSWYPAAVLRFFYASSGNLSHAKVLLSEFQGFSTTSGIALELTYIPPKKKRMGSPTSKHRTFSWDFRSDQVASYRTKKPWVGRFASLGMKNTLENERLEHKNWRFGRWFFPLQIGDCYVPS